jgi:hypothetical protein
MIVVYMLLGFFSYYYVMEVEYMYSQLLFINS